MDGVFADRFKGWPGVYIGNAGDDVCTQVRQLCEDYDCPDNRQWEQLHM